MKSRLQIFCGCAALFLSKCAAAQEMPYQESISVPDKKNAYFHNILSSNENAFQEVYGAQTDPQVVVFFFTSQTCAFCRIIHLTLIPELLQKKIPGLLVIVREFPADFYSLWAAAIAWSLPAYAYKIKETLFQKTEGENSWITPNPEETRFNLQNIGLSFCTTPEEKKVMESATTDKALLQAIYKQKTEDKEAIDIDEVPVGWVFIPGESPRSLAIKDPSNMTDIIKAIEEASSSPKKPDEKGPKVQ